MKGTEYRDLTLRQIADKLSQPQPTVILMHVSPDGDAVGSAFALACWLREMGSPAYCLCAEEIPARLRFLMGDEQESLLLSSLPQGFEDARVVTVDVASPMQLGSLWEVFGERISLEIDHHERGTRYADGIVQGCAATGELIYELFALGTKEITKRAAELMYAALTTDTGGFRYSNTTPETHLRAARLLACGIDAANLNHLLLEVKSKEILSAEAAGYSMMQTYADGRVAIIPFDFETKKRLGLENEHLSTLVDVARKLAGVQIAVAIRQPDAQSVFRVSMRASVDFDVSAVCATFGGGGHPRAAGATLTAYKTIEQATAAVLAAIEARL